MKKETCFEEGRVRKTLGQPSIIRRLLGINYLVYKNTVQMENIVPKSQDLRTTPRTSNTYNRPVADTLT